MNAMIFCFLAQGFASEETVRRLGALVNETDARRIDEPDSWQMREEDELQPPHELDDRRRLVRRRYTVTDRDMERLCLLDREQTKNNKDETPLPRNQYGYVYYPPNKNHVRKNWLAPKVLITTPHAHLKYRYNDPVTGTDYHKQELRVGAMVKLLSELTGMPALRDNYLSDDANYYDVIPSNTRTPGWREKRGRPIPFKNKLRSIMRDIPSVKVVLDLHGIKTLAGGPSNWAVDIGTGHGRSLSGARGRKAQQQVGEAFKNSRLSTTWNKKYTGMIKKETVTSFSVRTLRKDAMQFEIASKYRGCSTAGKREMKKVVQSLVDSILELQLQVYKD